MTIARMQVVNSFAVVERRTAAAGAIDQIRDLVVGGVLKPGQKLPSERVLCDRLGVSRPSLREAIRALGAMGILDIRQGSGIYVSDLSSAALATPISFLLDINKQALEDVIDVRLLLEVGATRAAASRITPEELQRLEALLVELERSVGDADSYLKVDVAFHRTIHQASGNRLIAALMESLFAIELKERRVTASYREARIAGLKGHRTIFEALEARNPETAGAAMYSHINNSRPYLLKGRPAKAR